MVKADSEGNIGPLTYNRTEADGANLLARAVAPHDGIVMWRAFVYGNKDFGTEELVKQSYRPIEGVIIRTRTSHYESITVGGTG